MNEYNYTNKEEKAIQAYLQGENKTSAYRLAYNCANMKDTTVNRKAKELFDKDKITARIDEFKKETYDRNKATIDEVISIASDMVRADISEAYNDDGSLKKLKDIPKALRMAIAGTESSEMTSEGQVIGQLKKLKLVNKVPVMDMFMKHYGGYAKDNELKVNVEIPLFPDVCKDNSNK